MLSLQEEIEEVHRLRNQEDLTWEVIGARLGFSARTAARRYETYLDLEQPPVEELLDDEQFSVSVTSDYVPEDKEPLDRFKPLKVYGDCMVTMDYHIPLHDAPLINEMIRVAKDQQHNQLIIAGDYWNMDTFSSFLPHQPEAAWPVERDDGNIIMKTLLRTFDEIYMCWGNHDFRLAKATGFKHSFTECMKWALAGLDSDELSRIHFSDLDYILYYPGDDREYRVCHPRNFSSIPLAVPRQLAPKYDSSIITAHSHHCAMGVAVNGTDLIIDGGGFFDKTRTEYIQKTSKFHEWVPGFVEFVSGIPQLYSPVFGNLNV